MTSFVEPAFLIVFNHSTGNDVKFWTLGSMEVVHNFVSGIVKSLPPRASEDDSKDGFINPDTFSSPSWKRLRSKSLEMSSANPQGGSSSRGRQMAFWSIAPVYNNNLGDVANLLELDCFNVDSVH